MIMINFIGKWSNLDFFTTRTFWGRTLNITCTATRFQKLRFASILNYEQT